MIAKPTTATPTSDDDQAAARSPRRGGRTDPFGPRATDPRSPWQRGTNENTNGLLRQYFPRGTDLARHSAEELAAVAATLNGRPRKALGWKTPAEVLTEYLSAAA